MSESATATATASASATNGANVPVTAVSCFASNGNPISALKIGDHSVRNDIISNNNPEGSWWWLVVVDLTNLDVVANVLGDGRTVPPTVQPYLNNPKYFLFSIGNCLQGHQIPADAFYTFLQQVGSGRELARLEQAYRQFKSGIFQNYSYMLAATMDTTDYPGFETLSFTNSTVLAMQFMPVKVNGQTTYTPINPFAG